MDASKKFRPTLSGTSASQIAVELSKVLYRVTANGYNSPIAAVQAIADNKAALYDYVLDKLTDSVAQEYVDSVTAIRATAMAEFNRLQTNQCIHSLNDLFLLADDDLQDIIDDNDAGMLPDFD